jgi:UDP-N-acetylmuramate dehydrogenase
MENLSLIPGTVGASPIQNIGAYGVEVKDSFEELEAFELETSELKTFTAADCAFGYRDSVFKKSLKNKFVIVSVTFRLSKRPVLQTGYGAIRDELARLSITEPTVRDVSNAVINIRRSKLPDPAVIGNAGSFFKNPEISLEVFQKLQSAYPGIPGYSLENGIKLAAGWLIEQCGWKGYRRGDAGCHAKQALVLVNYGNASGEEIYALSTDILHSVKEKFGVELEREVNMI